MATTRILYPAWREYNGPTNYPFVDTATLRNDSGIFIPEGAILDAVLYPVGGGSLLRLSKVVVTQQSVTVYVGDETNDELCSGELQFDNANDELRLQDAYGRPAGLLVSEVNQLLTFLAWPPGTHAFTYAQAGFTLDVCIPAAEPAVRGFLLRATRPVPAVASALVPNRGKVKLGHGSLLVMGRGVQGTYQHSLPRRAHAGLRVNLTFRAPA